MNKMTLLITGALFITALIIAELIYIRLNGEAVSVPDIPRQPITIGAGPEIKYAILGDSTGVGQGGDYSMGIAVSSAEFLAQSRRVTYRNFSVAGATMADVRIGQLKDALAFRPDIVLVSAGANDVTHLTPNDGAANDLELIIKELKGSNKHASIFVTGSPQMGSIPRFPQPLRHFARLKTESLNKRLFNVARKYDAVIVPIAEKTGPLFDKDPSLFAKDKFHPDNEGYATWVDVVNEILAASGMHKK